MDFQNLLFVSYTFTQLLTNLIKEIGWASFIVIIGSYLAIVAYLTAMPMLGLFSAIKPQIVIFGLFQQVFYLFSFLQLFIIVALGFNQGLFQIMTFLAYYTPFLIASLGVTFSYKKDFTYHEFLQFKTDPRSFTRTNISKFTWYSLLWIVIVGECIGVILINPIFPIINWIYFFYSLAYTFLQAAIIYGLFYQLRHSIPITVITNDGKETSGFLVGKGPDHYLLKKKEGDLLLQNSYVQTIIPSQPNSNSQREKNDGARAPET